jgi:hypothetical protein
VGANPSLPDVLTGLGFGIAVAVGLLLLIPWLTIPLWRLFNLLDRYLKWVESFKEAEY